MYIEVLSLVTSCMRYVLEVSMCLYVFNAIWFFYMHAASFRTNE